VQPDDHLILFLTDRRHSKPSRNSSKAPPLLVKDILLRSAHVFALVMMVFAVTMLGPRGAWLVWATTRIVVIRISGLATFALGACYGWPPGASSANSKDSDGLMLVALDLGRAARSRGLSAVAFLAHQFHRCYFEAASG